MRVRLAGKEASGPYAKVGLFPGVLPGIKANIYPY